MGKGAGRSSAAARGRSDRSSYLRRLQRLKLLLHLWSQQSITKNYFFPYSWGPTLGIHGDLAQFTYIIRRSSDTFKQTQAPNQIRQCFDFPPRSFYLGSQPPASVPKYM